METKVLKAWNNGCRLERWSIFHGDGMVMVVFLQRWNGDGFENFSPSPLMVFGGINHWQQWFFNGFFPILVHDGYKLKFATNCMAIEMLKTKIQAKDLFHKKTRKLVNKKQKNLIFNLIFQSVFHVYVVTLPDF